MPYGVSTKSGFSSQTTMHEFRKFIEIVKSNDINIGCQQNFKAQATVQNQLSYIFLISAQMVNLMNGALAIVTIRELSRDAEWGNSDFSRHVGSVTQLAIDTAISVTDSLAATIAHAKKWLAIEQGAEVEGLKEVLSAGEIYLKILKNLALQTHLSALHQGLLGAENNGLGVAIRKLGLDMQPASDCLRRIAAQILSVQLMIEALDAERKTINRLF